MTEIDDLRRLFDDAPCGYAVLAGPEGPVRHANAELARLVGRPVRELVGTATLASLLTVGGRILLETHLLPMLEHDGVVREVALDLLRPDGGRVPVLLNASTSAGDPAVRVVLFEVRDRHRYEQDLLVATRAAEQARSAATALAQTLQQTLIPPAPPEIPHLTIAAAYRPAGDGTMVGGDFYDVFQVGADAWCVVLGDVSGKGASAAAVTSFVRYTTRALALDHPDPSDLLRRLDRALRAHGTDHYCTVVVAFLARHGEAWEVRLALAGHPPALLRDAATGLVHELGVFGSPIGLLETTSFTTVTHLLRDETLTLYTDGVTEARGEDGLFGESRLERLIAGGPHDPRAITDAITEEVLRYQRGVAADDIAVVTLAARSSDVSGPPAARGS